MKIKKIGREGRREGEGGSKRKEGREKGREEREEKERLLSITLFYMFKIEDRRG